MNKLSRVILSFVFFGIFFPSPTFGTSPADTLRVGFILPLSGEWAFLGNGIRDGALLAQQDIQKDGSKIDLIFEDNHGDLTTSATIAAKLINSQKPDALISIISGVGKILKPMATKSQIINIGICSDTDVTDGKYSFINYLTAEQGVAKYIDYFSKTIGAQKSVAVLSLNEAGFQKIVDQLNARAAGHVEIRAVENFDKGSSDFRSVLLRVKSKQPDALLILGLSPEIELIAKQARALNLNIPLTSIEGFGLASDKAPFEGAWFIDSAVPNAEFRQRFQKTYGREVTPGVGHSYDSVMLLQEAFQKSKQNSQPLADIFRKLDDFSGSTGKLSVRNDGVIWSDASVKIIINGLPQLAAP